MIVEDHVNGNGRTAVPVGGDAGDDETQERQRWLFSWSGFMADETPELKGRRWVEVSTLSLFEWALDCVACEGVLVHIWREGGLERGHLHGKRHDGGYEASALVVAGADVLGSACVGGGDHGSGVCWTCVGGFGSGSASVTVPIGIEAAVRTSYPQARSDRRHEIDGGCLLRARVFNEPFNSFRSNQ